MKVIYEKDYAPYINYDDAYVYLDTSHEELSIEPYYTINAQNGVDFAWHVRPTFDKNAYNDLLDEIKPLADELLEHHVIYDRRGSLDDMGMYIEDAIEQLIDERMASEDRLVYTVESSIEDVHYYYSPWDISPSKLKQIAREEFDHDGDYVLYFNNDAEEYELASMIIIGNSIENMNARKASEYLSHIYSVYKKDGFASDFENVLLPFLEENGGIEFIDGDWYLAYTEDDEENHIPLEWK